MSWRHKIAVVLFSGLMAPVWAYGQSHSYSGRTATSTSKLKRSSGTQWSVIIPSFVVHGIKPDYESSQLMPRRMDKSGNTVMTPGVGLKYQGPEGGLVVIGAVKDCYDNFAGAFQWGKYFNVSKNTHWGITGGFYIRETPYACDPVYRGGRVQTECIEMDDFNAKWIANINGVNIDIIPMPFLHFATSLYKDRDFEIQLKLMSNVVLNEFGVAIPF